MKTLAYIAGITLLNLSSLGCSPDSKESPNQKSNLETISGIPLAVESNTSYHDKNFSAVIQKKDDKIILIAHYDRYGNREIIEATALIQSEIEDGDDEKIEATGYYKNNRFHSKSLKVEDYEF